MNDTEATVMTSCETTEAKTPNRSNAEEATFFVGTPNTKGDVSFMDSVGNITMDAFGFPVEPTTPGKSAKKVLENAYPNTPSKSVKGEHNTTFPNTPAKSAKSVKAVPICARDSPAKAMRSSKSAPSLNRLIAHAQVQAHYKDPIEFQADFSEAKPDSSSIKAEVHEAESTVEGRAKLNTPRSSSIISAGELTSVASKLNTSRASSTKSLSESPSVASKLNTSRNSTSKSLNGSVANKLNTSKNTVNNALDESISVASKKINNAVELPNEAKSKSIVSDSDIEKMLDEIEDPNKSCDDDALVLNSVDFSDPLIRADSSKSHVTTRRSGSPRSVMEGSFDAQESTIDHLDSSCDIPMRPARPQTRRKRLPPSKLRCSDDAVYCNLNLKEVEKVMWEFMDAFDERAGKCGYVVGCTDRVPREVNTSVNDTFSVLEDDSLLNKMVAEQSVSLLDSITIDE